MEIFNENACFGTNSSTSTSIAYFGPLLDASLSLICTFFAFISWGVSAHNLNSVFCPPTCGYPIAADYRTPAGHPELVQILSQAPHDEKDLHSYLYFMQNVSRGVFCVLNIQPRLPLPRVDIIHGKEHDLHNKNKIGQVRVGLAHEELRIPFYKIKPAK